MRRRGDHAELRHRICVASRGLREELTEEERYRVANEVVRRLKQHGDPWRMSEDLPPPRKGHSTYQPSNRPENCRPLSFWLLAVFELWGGSRFAECTQVRLSIKSATELVGCRPTRLSAESAQHMRDFQLGKTKMSKARQTFRRTEVRRAIKAVSDAARPDCCEPLRAGREPLSRLSR